MGNETPDFRKGGRPRKLDLDRRTKLIAARVRPDELAAIEFLLDKMKDTKTNADFFDAMKR